MRGSVVLVAVLAVTAQAEPPIWQQASSAPPIARMWGTGTTIYGVGAAGAYFSNDNGASWAPTDGSGAANGVWGTGPDDIWVVRARTIHHSTDGHATDWTTHALPMLSFDAAMEGMWGIDRERYLFGVDRPDGTSRGTILRSRDRGASWRVESLPIAVERIAGMWGSGANDVYAVGSRGVVLHSTGDGQWRVVRAPTTGSLEGVWGANAKSIYVVGTNGAILFSGDRGKTWTPRASGVRYTLSSIVGVDREILVGSADGPPLRSTDGATWRPMTALVARGHVWASDRHVIVAATTGVQFLGASPIVYVPSAPPRPPALPTAQGCTNKDVLEAAGDAAATAGDYFRALVAYQRVAHCQYRLVIKTYHLACVTQDFTLAFRHFSTLALPKPKLDELAAHCVSRGFDPRTNRPTTRP